MKAEYKSLYEKFGLNVVFYRKRRKMTQLQLAELVGIDRSHISAIELGNVGVSFDVIFKLCEVLGVSPKELFDFLYLCYDKEKQSVELVKCQTYASFFFTAIFWKTPARDTPPRVRTSALSMRTMSLVQTFALSIGISIN